jgi:hypothetical protein
MNHTSQRICYHNFGASQIIELPFGHGKRFLSHSDGLTQSIIGGWQLNSITTLQTGKPFNVVSKGNDLNYPGLRPNLVGNPTKAPRTVSRWFNVSAFSIPTGQAASTTPGKTMIVGNSPRKPLFGPGYTNEDLSLFKVFTMPRQCRLMRQMLPDCIKAMTLQSRCCCLFLHLVNSLQVGNTLPYRGMCGSRFKATWVFLLERSRCRIVKARLSNNRRCRARAS